MADGTENEKDTKNIESSAKETQSAEGTATDRFREELQGSLAGTSGKGAIQEAMGKMPMNERTDKMPANEQTDKLKIENKPSEQIDKRNVEVKPSDQIDKRNVDAKPSDQIDKRNIEAKPDGGTTKPQDRTMEGKDEAKDKLDKFDTDKDGKLNELEKSLSEELPEREELPTGDVIKRDEDGETLTTPNGDQITVNADGSHSIKGDVKSVETKDGITTVKLGDGSEVSFDEEGILSVQRGDQGVSFGRYAKGSSGGGGWGGGTGGRGMGTGPGGLGGIGGGDMHGNRAPRIEDFLPRIKLK